MYETVMFFGCMLFDLEYKSSVSSKHTKSKSFCAVYF